MCPLSRRYCNTGSMSRTSVLENEPKTLLFIFVHTLIYRKVYLGSNKGMTQNRHGVYRKNTGAWSPDYTDTNNIYTHCKNTID